MIFKSIRWRLQIWYGVILIAVLAGFGTTAYQLERGRQLQRIEGELQRRMNLVATLLRPGPRDRMQGERPFARDPLREPPGDRSGRRGAFEELPQGEALRPPATFRMPPEETGLFDEANTNGFYYVVWHADGREFARSMNAPAELPPLPVVSRPLRRDGPRLHGEGPPLNRARDGDMPLPRPPRLRDSFMETLHRTPRGEIILVGRSISNDLHDLRLFAAKLAGAGGVILLLGLLGGAWMVSRAMRPIHDIGATASLISAGDLSQRINASDAATELAQLANVLNSTFARLETAFAQQRQFTSDAAHELRTPVSVMLTQTQTALNRERSAVEYRESVEACQRAAERMRRLIESLLQLARFDAGQEQLKRMRFDLGRVASDAIEFVQPLAAARAISVRSDLSTVECLGDPNRMAQVVENLLTNAVNYNRDGGEIRVVVGRDGGNALLSVSDTGIGISPEHLPRVFERFYRADTARTAAQGRTGLGLAIAKAIVTAHAGSIEVESQPGSGTTFTVRLAMAP